jgi:hypothetical protein
MHITVYIVLIIINQSARRSLRSRTGRDSAELLILLCTIINFDNQQGAAGTKCIRDSEGKDVAVLHI